MGSGLPICRALFPVSCDPKSGSRGRTVLHRCISYPLLCSKLPQNSAAKSNRHLLSHGFLGSGIWARLSWVPPVSGLSKAAINVSSGAAVISRHTWGGVGRGRLPPCSGSCWLFAGGRHMPPGLLQGLFITQQLDSSRDCERERARGHPRQKPVSCNLIMEVTSHHFCRILFMRSK